MAGSSEPKGDKKGEKMDLSSDAADSKVPSVDYSEQIGQQQALAQSGQLEGALQNLLALEKPSRLVRDPAIALSLTRHANRRRGCACCPWGPPHLRKGSGRLPPLLLLATRL